MLEAKNTALAQIVRTELTNPMRIPVGWYVVMTSKELKGKKALPVTVFGQELVAWRDNKGQPVLMERYCSHMGASLEGARVKDGCVECPFHKWRYNQTGQCVVAPTINPIPKTAWQEVYTTVERYGFIWAWYGTPEPLYPLIDFSLFEPSRRHHPDFMQIRMALRVKTTVRRILENVYDQYHFVTVHDFPATVIGLHLAPSTGLEGVSTNLSEATQAEMDKLFTGAIPQEIKFAGMVEAYSEKFIGPVGGWVKKLGLHTEQTRLCLESFPSGHLVTLYLGGVLVEHVLLAVQPIEPGLTIQHSVTLIKKSDKPYLNPIYFAFFGIQSLLSLAQDARIWNKFKADGGRAFTKNDQGVLKYRTYYNRWVDKIGPGQS